MKTLIQTARTALRRGGLAATAIAALALTSERAAAEDARRPAPQLEEVTAQHNGGFATSVPIELPSYRGLEPRLRLAYNSGAGNGTVGVGFHLTGVGGVIERRDLRGGRPRYLASDQYYLDDEPLFLFTGVGGTHARRRQTFERVVFDTPNNVWYVTERDGSKTAYGPAIGTASGVFRWVPVWTATSDGESVQYGWDCSDGQDCYLANVRYNGTFVAFHYQARVDPQGRTDAPSFSDGRAIRRTNRLLRSIDVCRRTPGAEAACRIDGAADPARVRSYRLEYGQLGETARSYLVAVQPYGSDARLGAGGAVVGGSALPPWQFRWSAPGHGWNPDSNRGSYAPGHGDVTGGRFCADVTGDGRADLVYSQMPASGGPEMWVAKGSGAGFAPAANWGQRALETLQEDGGFANGAGHDLWLADLNRDGIADLLYAAKGTKQMRVQLSNGSGFGADTVWATRTADFAPSGAGPQRWVADTDGDGRMDFIYQEAGKDNLRLLRSTGTTFNPDRYFGKIEPDHKEAWIVDVTGDGKADLVFRTQGNDVRVARSLGSTLAPVETWATTPFDGPIDIYVDDFNGDHVADIAYRSERSKQVFVRLSTGSAFGPPQVWTTLRLDSGLMFPMDVNGDGLSDLVYQTTDQTNNGRELRVAVSTGSAFAPDRAWGTRSLEAERGDDGIFFCDATGDGRPEILFQADNTNVLRGFGEQGPGQLLVVGVTSPLGGSMDLSYKPSSATSGAGTMPSGSVLWLLEQSVQHDGRGGADMTTTFTYERPSWQYDQRRFLGFRTVTSTNAAGLATVTTYTTHVADPVGTTERVIRRDGAGAQWTVDQWYYARSGDGVTTPFTSLLIERRHSDCNGDTSCPTTRRTFDHDGYGNVTVEVDHGDSAVTGDERNRLVQYRYNTAAHLVSFPVRETTYAGTTTTGTVLADRIYAYDGQAHPEAPTRGHVTDTLDLESYPGAADRWVRNVARTYDGAGNVTSETNGTGATTSFAYDGTYNLFPTRTTNALGHVVTDTWDATCGLRTRRTDPNGAITQWRYDALCRPIQETRPDGGATYTSYVAIGSPGTQRIDTAVADGTADGQWTQTFMDGLGRSYRTVRKGDRIADVVYDARGLVARRSAPHGTDEPAAFSTLMYDLLGRVTREEHADGKARTTTYGDRSRTERDEANAPTEYLYDAYGALVRVREVTYEPNPYDTIITRDLLGRMVATTDSVGNQTRIAHDTLGRRRARRDPDLGTWAWQYDDVGRATRQVDARGKTVNLSYDALGRVTRKSDGADNTTLASFAYDQPRTGAANIGHMTSLETPSAAIDRDYDLMGRLARESRTVDRNTDTLQWTYDVAGRLSTLTYPDGEVLTHQYDAASRHLMMTSSIGNTTYVSNTVYDARDHIKSRSMGDRSRDSYAWNANRFWLTAIDTRELDADKKETITESIRLSRDLRGLVTARTSTGSDDDWNYTYDRLQRLTGATNTARPEWNESFTLDPIGRITEQAGVGTYTYPAAGVDSVRPHAPTRVGASSLTYDANGNLLTGFGRTLRYDTQNRLVNDGTSAIEYDAEGSRVKLGARVFVRNLVEREGSTITKHYFAGGDHIARREGLLVTYYHPDGLGTSRVLTGSRPGRQILSTFGRRLSHTATGNAFGLADQRLDASGLYHMGARYMDPRVGQFTQPDPSDFPDGGRPQTLNRYSYVANNPISLSDPTGFRFDPGSGDFARDTADRDPSRDHNGDGRVDSGDSDQGGDSERVGFFGGILNGFVAATDRSLTATPIPGEALTPGGVIGTALGLLAGNVANFADFLPGARVAKHEAILFARVTLFRGINSTHPMYAEALAGNIRPFGTDTSLAAVNRHTEGYTAKTGFTSWSTSEAFARDFAVQPYDGPPSSGVVVRAEIDTKQIHTIDGAPVVGVVETLVKGPVSGGSVQREDPNIHDFLAYIRDGN